MASAVPVSRSNWEKREPSERQEVNVRQRNGRSHGVALLSSCSCWTARLKSCPSTVSTGDEIMAGWSASWIPQLEAAPPLRPSLRAGSLRLFEGWELRCAELTSFALLPHRGDCRHD